MEVVKTAQLVGYVVAPSVASGIIIISAVWGNRKRRRTKSSARFEVRGVAAAFADDRQHLAQVVAGKLGRELRFRARIS